MSLVVQVLGVLLAGGLAVAARESPMTVATVVLAAAGGVVGVIGILGLYQGLAVGRMGVVAPVTGVLAAALPVAVGIVEDGLPRATVIVGIGLAFVAVALVSRVAGPDGGRSGLEFAIVGGVGIGIFNVIVGGLPVGQVFGPLVVVKIAAAVAILVIAAVGRKPWRIPSAVLPVALLVGVFDMGGNALFVLASQAGRLDVAATLSSLYPVTTVILAILLLGERPTRNHLAGIVAAGVAIALISSGSAG